MAEESACREHEEKLQGRALLLSYFTVGYNVLEGVASIAAGALAGSVALVGFGLDSFIESISGGVMIWRFSQRGLTEEEERKVEAKAVRLVGWSFFILAAYVLFEAAKKLLKREIPQPSLFGIAVAAASLIIMPLLYIAKQRTGRKLGSHSLVADSRQTLACTLMSAALLLGLLANRLFGLWQADPVVGGFIGIWLIREGIETLRSRELCSC
jgi:divalent metal cation (Fe/Co/Zn/Cd) transporter